MEQNKRDFSFHHTVLQLYGHITYIAFTHTTLKTCCDSEFDCPIDKLIALSKLLVT